MRLLFLDWPHLALRLALGRDPGAQEAIVLGGRPWDPASVIDHSPAAGALGVRRGQPLGVAHSLAPDAVFLPFDGAALRGPLHGFPGQAGFFRRSAGPGWALVGDAAYFKDPITAHGITDALIDAEALARAAQAGTDAALLDYDASRVDRAAALFEVTDRIASFDWTLDEARLLHKRLAEEMSREVKALQAWAPQEMTA